MSQLCPVPGGWWARCFVVGSYVSLAVLLRLSGVDCHTKFHSKALPRTQAQNKAISAPCMRETHQCQREDAHNKLYHQQACADALWLAESSRSAFRGRGMTLRACSQFPWHAFSGHHSSCQHNTDIPTQPQAPATGAKISCSFTHLMRQQHECRRGFAGTAAMHAVAPGRTTTLPRLITNCSHVPNRTYRLHSSCNRLCRHRWVQPAASGPLSHVSMHMQWRHTDDQVWEFVPFSQRSNQLHTSEHLCGFFLQSSSVLWLRPRLELL